MAFIPYETSMGGGTSGGGIRVYLCEADTSSGTGSVKTPLSVVYSVCLTQKNATAIADTASWSASGGTITVDNSSTGAQKYSVLAIGI